MNVEELIPHRRRHAWKFKLVKLLAAISMELVVALFGIALLLLIVREARAHGEYQWVMTNQYTAYCCTPRDCRPIPEATVIDADPALTYRPTGQQFTRGATGLENSRDERYHGCFYEGTDRLRCLFVPAKAY